MREALGRQRQQHENGAEQEARSVLLIDDHPLIRRGLRDTMVERLGIPQIEEAETLREATAALSSGRRWDLVTLDLTLQNEDGMVLLDRFGRSNRARFLVLSQKPATQYAVECFAKGAHGYVGKTDPYEEMLKALRLVAEGQHYMPEGMALLLQSRLAEPARSADVLLHECLSPRELELLKLIGDSKSLKECADVMDISIKTVGGYHTSLLQKMGMQTDVALAKYVGEHKLLPQ